MYKKVLKLQRPTSGNKTRQDSIRKHCLSWNYNYKVWLHQIKKTESLIGICHQITSRGSSITGKDKQQKQIFTIASPQIWKNISLIILRKLIRVHWTYIYLTFPHYLVHRRTRATRTWTLSTRRVLDKDKLYMYIY